MMAKTSKKAVKPESTDTPDSQASERLIINPEEMAQPTSQVYGNTLGDILRAAREAQNITIQDAASRLRLSAKQLEALEDNRFAELPNAVTTRGFIRNYAKLLKLAAEPLLEHYRVAVPTQMPPKIAVTTSIEAHTYRKSPLGLILLGGILTAAIGYGLFAINKNKLSTPTEVVQDKPMKDKPVAEILPQPALPAAERPDANQPPLTASGETSGLATAPADTVAVVPPTAIDSSTTTSPSSTLALPAAGTHVEPVVPPANQPSEISSTAALPAQTPPTALPANESGFSFAATQDTWVEVRDADGKLVLSEVIAAGSEKKLDIKAPLKVVVGNKNGGVLKFNGAVVDMAPYGGKDVARLTLR